MAGHHPEFEKLCALFFTGTLTGEEIARLNEHLSGCSDCQQYMEQFQRKSTSTIAALGPKQAPDVPLEESFDANSAKKRFVERISKDEEEDDDAPIGGRLEYAVATMPGYARNIRFFSQPLVFVQSFRPFLPYAASFLLALGVSLVYYWNGPRKQADEIRISADRSESAAAASREQAKELSKERDALNSRLQERTNTVLALQTQIAQLQRRISELETSGSRTVQEKQEWQSVKEGLGKSLEYAQSTVMDLRNQLDSSRQQHTNESLKVADLERRVDQLSASVAEQHQKIEQQDAALEQQQELLAHDRDIRDLMGARKLYVAEVYDSDENGRPKKPYARVFYTKDRSLIFYGFDLDRQPGLKNASTFQVWGRQGPNRENALNLGILFEDSATNKRWVLKINDPMKLQQIDAVFVTIEPKGGSVRPTGKPLLFAYLHVDPNHP